ncbi:MAG: DNA polymerase III subunit chi, partial [Pseudomonadota bacterium]
LWTFRDEAFVPHCLADDPAARETGADGCVIIGNGHEPAERCALLINLAPDVPRFFSRVARVAEIIDTDPERRAQGRTRYSFYRDRGYPVRTHNL